MASTQSTPKLKAIQNQGFVCIKKEVARVEATIAQFATRTSRRQRVI
jgi:hypothetical protein